MSRTIISLTRLSVRIRRLLLGSSIKSPVRVIDDNDSHIWNLKKKTDCVIKRAAEPHLHDFQ